MSDDQEDDDDFTNDPTVHNFVVDRDDTTTQNALRQYKSADFYSTYDLGSHIENVNSSTTMNKVNECMKRFFLSMTVLNIFFLTLLGVTNAIVSFCLDYLISRVLMGRSYFSSLTNIYWVNYSMWILYCMVFAFFAVMIPQAISKYSIGSGIPEMKSILSGIRMERYLGLRTLIAKFLGLISSFGAGMQIGKEGPFVHISSCIAHLLLMFPCFKRIRENEYYKNQIYSVASAAGIAATFGTPFGGVLFSIEVCSTYFPVECLWKGVFCSLVGSSIFYLFRSLGFYNNVEVNLFETNFDSRIEIEEYFPMAIMAVICGFLGVLFILLVKFLVSLRQKTDFLNKNSFFLVLCCSFIIAAFTFPLNPFLRESNYTVVNLLFSEKDMSEELTEETMTHNKSLLLSLAFSSFAKFILTAVSISLPISCGLFTSVFIFGASLGRLFGELNKVIAGSSIIPGGYSVVCSACFASSVTRTLSTAVVLFELTGQLEYLLPTLMAIVISTLIGNLLSLSIYDTILKLKGLPIFSILLSKEQEKFDLKAEDVMVKKINFVCTNYTIPQLESTLTQTDHLQYPLVDEKMIFMGEIQRENIFLYLKDVNGKVKGYSRIEMAQKVAQEEQSLGIKFQPKTKEKQKGVIYYDPSILSISKETSLQKINFLFSHLGLSKIFVVSLGVLNGVITKKHLIKLNE